MGDRVYSNEKDKYYSLPGLNAYVMNANVDVPAATGNAPNTDPEVGLFSFNSAGLSVVQFPMCELIGGSGLTINETGMYSIKLLIGATTTASPTTVDLDFYAKMTLTRTGDALTGIILAASQDRYSAPGSSAGSNSKIICLDSTTFLREGDEINIVVENYSSGVLRLLQNTCQLMVSKIY